MSQLSGVRIHISGVVQGVGFRPFVYGLAQRLELTGWVRNSSAGVDIEADGPPEVLEQFTQSLRSEAPALARIENIQIGPRVANGFTTFEIIHSEAVPGAYQPISPDICICPDCLRELFDPNDRRYRYPFINCTNCGPRFTIIEDIPYDRPQTTMAPFRMCLKCEAEYSDPLDRRFHAQPIACPDCGPEVWLEYSSQFKATETMAAGQRRSTRGEEAIQTSLKLLAEGKILAVKGLGGFHLACEATNEGAVSELRRRKLRVDKPFALMMPDMAVVKSHCFVNEAEKKLLESAERPIVILRRRSDSTIVEQVAPGQKTLGVMLPYTPLHYLLLKPSAEPTEPLVMTSGNLSEEPIATRNEEARRRLGALADAFLMHDRDIRTRNDDSVIRVFSASDSGNNENSGAQENVTQGHDSAIYTLRRSRGYAPFPVKLPWDGPSLLAAGAELKNTFCLTRENHAFISHHIGDLENYETLRAFEDGVSHYERLFRIRPEAIAYDLHPDYLATRYAKDRIEQEGLPGVGVQHHHAHVAAVMAEHGLKGDRPVIGLAFDGTGYGDDGAIWGGEFLVADFGGYRRPYHLDTIPMPGGEAAVREPWRLALAWLQRAEIGWQEDLPPVQHAVNGGERISEPLPMDRLQVVAHQLQSRLNSPLTSSMGRLFDAVSALVGLRQMVNYEGQAAIELEALVDPAVDGAYSLAIRDGRIDPRPLIQAIVADQRVGTPVSTIAARFHNGVAQMVTETCRHMRRQYGLTTVALSGGVWQNMVLLERVLALLEKEDFTVLRHRLVPANDGGLALGQAAVAAYRLMNGQREELCV